MQLLPPASALPKGSSAGRKLLACEEAAAKPASMPAAKSASMPAAKSASMPASMPAAKPAAKAPATIAEAAAGAKDLSILLAAVKESSLLKAATDPATAVTVFAPTNKVRAGSLMQPPALQPAAVS